MDYKKDIHYDDVAAHDMEAIYPHCIADDVLKQKRTVSYKLGTACAYAILLCFTAIVVALSLKFIFWLF